MAGETGVDGVQLLACLGEERDMNRGVIASSAWADIEILEGKVGNIGLQDLNDKIGEVVGCASNHPQPKMRGELHANWFRHEVYYSAVRANHGGTETTVENLRLWKKNVCLQTPDERTAGSGLGLRTLDT